MRPPSTLQHSSRTQTDAQLCDLTSGPPLPPHSTRAHVRGHPALRLTLVIARSGGPNFYVVAAVDTGGKRTSTRRRFNDLVALHEALKVSFRGCVIPFRPGKTFANSTVLRTHKDSFLKDRAYAIRCYLCKVVCHPEIKAAEVRTDSRCRLLAGAAANSSGWIRVENQL